MPIQRPNRPTLTRSHSLTRLIFLQPPLVFLLCPSLWVVAPLEPEYPRTLGLGHRLYLFDNDRSTRLPRYNRPTPKSCFVWRLQPRLEPVAICKMTSTPSKLEHEEKHGHTCLHIFASPP